MYVVGHNHEDGGEKKRYSPSRRGYQLVTRFLHLNLSYQWIYIRSAREGGGREMTTDHPLAEVD